MLLRTQCPLCPAVGRWAALVLALAALTGCRPAEQITKYTAPREATDANAISDEPAPGEPATRILGAIAPAGKGDNDWFFFKIQSKPQAVERHVREFDAFIQSLKFAPEGPPSWKVPDGWREVTTPNRPDRIATFRMKKSETSVELAVTRFGGPLLANINRWRQEQAGADAITEAEIETKCRVLTVDGRRIVIVDVSGPGGKGGMMAPFAKQ